MTIESEETLDFLIIIIIIICLMKSVDNCSNYK